MKRLPWSNLYASIPYSLVLLDQFGADVNEQLEDIMMNDRVVLNGITNMIGVTSRGYAL